MSVHKPLTSSTVARDLTIADLRDALVAGWRDFAARPVYGLVFGAIYMLGGLTLFYGLTILDRGWWLIPVIGGFPLLAPFTAVGLYEVSRRRAAGLPVGWRGVLGALVGRGDDQLILMGGIVFVAFSFWMIVAHGIFAIFLGGSGIGAESVAALLSSEAVPMLLSGGAVGGLFALGLFAITVISLPMLVDRDVDLITAIVASVAVVRANIAVMLVWAMLIAVALSAAMLPLFAGLLVVLPVLGHATWHLYRRALV